MNTDTYISGPSAGAIAAEMLAREDARVAQLRQAEMFEREAVALATVLQEITGGDTQPAVETRHYFGGGLYIREMIAQPGAIVVGRRHKTEFWNIVQSGEAIIVLNGQETRCKAGDKLISKAGVRKVGRVLPESAGPLVWLAVHPNPNGWGLADLEKLEAELFDFDADAVAYPEEVAEMRRVWGVGERQIITEATEATENAEQKGEQP
jgi:mannose-6-phosphate isomerase-like protein (cupin superfamily)